MEIICLLTLSALALPYNGIGDAMLKDSLDESVDPGISAGESVKRGECF